MGQTKKCCQKNRPKNIDQIKKKEIRKLRKKGYFRNPKNPYRKGGILSTSTSLFISLSLIQFFTWLHKKQGGGG